jgi:hypothetical protein
MRILGRLLLVLLGALGLAAVVWFGGLGPRAFVPGGVLWGETREPPADWSFTDRIGEIQVQTRIAGVLPWSVTTWVLADDEEHLFIAASDCDRVWTNRVKRDPDVRLRIDGVLYDLRAVPETDRAVAARLAPVVLAKYFGIHADTASWIPERNAGCIFRVGPRP